MSEESARSDDFEVYCMFCNKPLSDDDDIHLTFGPYGYDFDVMCGECMERSRQLQAGGAGQGGMPGEQSGADPSLDPFDLLASTEWGSPPDA